jgi:hypothetical protein
MKLDTDEPWFSEPHPQIQNCTGAFADWCDNHGACTCPEDGMDLDPSDLSAVKFTMDGKAYREDGKKSRCPLHGEATAHPFEDIYGEDSYEPDLPWSSPNSDPIGDLLKLKGMMKEVHREADYRAESDAVDSLRYATLGLASVTSPRKTRIIPSA